MPVARSNAIALKWPPTKLDESIGRLRSSHRPRFRSQPMALRLLARQGLTLALEADI